jgi:hypothetical protein
VSLPTTSNVTRPRAFGFHARLDTLLLRLSVTPDHPLDIITAELQAPAVNTAQTAEEIGNEFGQVFSRVDFTGGEGLDIAHKPGVTDLDRTRFWASQHIDVTNPRPGQPSKLTLLPPTANIETSADTNLHLAHDGTALMMAEGSGFRRSTDPTVVTPTFAGDDPQSGGTQNISDVTTLGADTYAACGSDGIQKKSGGSWTDLSATTTLGIWGVKRQLLAATGAAGNALDAVSGAGSHTTLVTLAAGQRWRDVCDAGQAVLACADDGAIYAFGFNSSGAAGGTLELKAQTDVGRGEVPYAVESDGTHIFYATREATPNGAIGRLYRAELVEGAYVLTAGQLLKQWGDQDATLDHCPRAIRATRDAVFVGVLEDDGAFLWRYDRVSTGLTRHLDLAASGLVVDLLVHAGRLYATVSAHGLRREQVGYFEGSGWLIGPLADFFTAAKKSWAGALLQHDALPVGTRLSLYFTTDPEALDDPDSSAWTLLKDINSGQDLEETPLGDVDARYLAGMVKLYSDDPDGTTGTVAPSVRSYSFRAYPGDGDIEVTMYVVISDTIERPGHRRQRVRGLGDRVYAELQGKEGGYAEMELYRPGLLFRGLVKQVGTRFPALVTKGSAADVCALKFRGRRIDNTEVPQGLLGVGALGLVVLGGVEAA